METDEMNSSGHKRRQMMTRIRRKYFFNTRKQTKVGASRKCAVKCHILYCKSWRYSHFVINLYDNFFNKKICENHRLQAEEPLSLPVPEVRF